jgi:hypothetical protein
LVGLCSIFHAVSPEGDHSVARSYSNKRLRGEDVEIDCGPKASAFHFEALQRLPFWHWWMPQHCRFPQQTSLSGLQPLFLQQIAVSGTQKFEFWPPGPGQHLKPGAHGGVHAWADARVPQIPATSTPPSNLSARRRPIGLARMRAASSKKRSMFSLLS